MAPKLIKCQNTYIVASDPRWKASDMILHCASDVSTLYLLLYPVFAGECTYVSLERGLLVVADVITNLLSPPLPVSLLP